MNKTVLHIIILIFGSPLCHAGIYTLDKEKESVIGSIEYTRARYEQTLLDIAREHDLGYHEIRLANPHVDTWIPGEQQEITLPKRFVLPVVQHTGIVLNIPEMRLYYFPGHSGQGPATVITHPVGIGREGWATPYINTKIIQKTEQPSWYPPESIRLEYASRGETLPERVPPGPENPLGDFALRLGLPSYLIHGTNRPHGVGMRVSSGCIRLYPEDIESLFRSVSLGTPVRIINQPYKVGIRGNVIFLQAHPFLQEDRELFAGNLTSVVKMIIRLTQDREYAVDWDMARRVIDQRNGIPVQIGMLLSPVQEPRYADAEKGKSMASNVLELKLETGINTD